MSKSSTKKIAVNKTGSKKAAVRKPRQNAPKAIIEQAKSTFLDALACGYSVSGAAKLADRTAACVYNWRNTDDDFRIAWGEAQRSGTDALEDEARRRAVEGVAQPIVYDGEVVAEKRVYSDQLLMFLLKARDRSKFGDKSQVDLNANLATASLSTDELDERIARLSGLADN